MAELLTARELVAALDSDGRGSYSTEVVRQWIRDFPPCPVAQRGKRGQTHRYDFAAVCAWLDEREARAAAKGHGELPPIGGDVGGRGVGSASNFDDPRLRKAEAEAVKVETENARLAGLLVPKDEVDRITGQLVTAVTGALTGLRSELKRELCAGGVEDTAGTIDRVVLAVQQRLADGGYCA